MPYSIAQLFDLIGAQIAPGNEREFIRLVREADHRLLEFGKWSWCREVIELTPASGIVSLPATHISILAARVDGKVKAVHSREFEFLDTGPGEISVEAPGWGSYRLHDMGFTAATPDIYSTWVKVNGFDPGGPFASFEDLQLDYVDDDATGRGIWAGGSGNALTWSEDDERWLVLINPSPGTCAYAEGGEMEPWNEDVWRLESDGTIVNLEIYRQLVTAAAPGVRRYKISGGIGLTEPLSVLAGKAPAEIETMDDWVHCPTLSAIKLAMLSIIYEESNNLARAKEFMGYALDELDAKARSIEGGAKQFHKNKENRGMGRSGRNSNFM